MKKLFGVAVVLALAACSSSSTNPDDPSNPGPGPGPGSDGGNGNDGGNHNPDPEGKTKGGTVMVTQIVTSAGGSEFINVSAFAGFYQGAGGSLGESSCKESSDGDCKITECETGAVGDAGPEDAGTPKMPHAGEVTLKGASEMKLTPDDKGEYSYGTQQTRLWAKDGDIAIKAAGADVPAFEKTLKSPAAVTVTAPAWPATPGQPIEIDRANDLEVKWTGGGAGSVQASVSSNAGSKTTTVACIFKSDAGTGKMPKSALAKLVTGGNGSISINAASIENVEPGGWKVSLMALTSATTSGGANASGLATIK